MEYLRSSLSCIEPESLLSPAILLTRTRLVDFRLPLYTYIYGRVEGVVTRLERVDRLIDCFYDSYRLTVTLQRQAGERETYQPWLLAWQFGNPRLRQL